MALKALITGASSGIGRAFAMELHKRGYDVLVIARRTELLQILCQELNALRTDSAHFFALDLSSDEGIKRAGEIIQKSDIDLLVNNVGRGSYGRFETLSLEAEAEMIKLNITAPFYLTHAVIPCLKAKQSGGIIFVSSIAAFQPLPMMSTYAATKSFNYSQALSLRAELKPFGIGVLVTCPGPTGTEFGRVAQVPNSMSALPIDSAELVARQSLQAYERGDSYVITGFRSKILAMLSHLVPASLSTRILYWLFTR